MVDRTGEALGMKNIVVDGITYPIKVKVGDVKNFLSTQAELKQKNELKNLIEVQFEFVTKLLLQGNPNLSKEDASLILEMDSSSFIKESMIALKLSKREDFDKEESLKN